MLNWPIFADAASNLRFLSHPNVLHHFDLALLNEDFAQDLAAEAVVKFGSHIVSKRIWAWIDKQPNLKLLSISDSIQRIDHLGRFEHLYLPHLSSALENIIHQIDGNKRAEGYKASRVRLEDDAKKDHSKGSNLYRSISRHIDNFLKKNRSNEGYFSARLAASISEPTNLFLSASMPVRDVDQFAKPTNVAIHVYANRGASGIDGVTSSAVGVALASKKPTILLIGDVAFLHDTNGLMLLKTISVPVLVVVFNNGGGGIFHFLPIAKEALVITPYLDTPHDVSIKSLCLAHQVDHELIADPVRFEDAIKRFFTCRTTSVLEVMIERDQNVRAHQELYRSLQSAL